MKNLKTTPKKTKKSKPAPRYGIEALEPRMLMDGDDSWQGSALHP